MKCAKLIAVILGLTVACDAFQATLAATPADRLTLAEQIENKLLELKANDSGEMTAEKISSALNHEIEIRERAMQSERSALEISGERLDVRRLVFRIHPDRENYQSLIERYRVDIREGRANKSALLNYVNDIAAFRDFSLSRLEAERLGLPYVDMPAENFHAAPDANHLAISWNEESKEWRLLGNLLPDGVFVAVVASASCPFTLAAASDIRSDKDLSSFFSSRSIWLAPQAEKLSSSSFRGWHERFPELPIAIVYEQSRWPEIARWDSVPTFYVFRDKQLITRLVGWPSSSRLAALRSTLIPERQ